MAVKNTLKNLPIIGPVLKMAWRRVGFPAHQAYLRHLPETDRATTYFNQPFYYPSRSLIGRFVASGGEWDGLVLRQILPIISQDAVVVEVGSNIGASTLVIADVLKQSRFLLVEAGDRYLPFLRKNAAALDGRVIGIETRAVSDGSVGEVVFNTNATTGTPSNVNYGAGVTSSRSVMTATLSEVCSQFGLDRVDFLKVDTDGYEVEVFGGASAVIEKHEPLIFTEFCPTALRRMHSPEEFFAMLVRLGCQSFCVFKHSGEFLGTTDKLAEIIRLMGHDYYVDLVCTPANGRYAAALSSKWVSPVVNRTEVRMHSF